MHEEFSKDFVHAEMMWRLLRTCKLGVFIHPKFSYLMWSSHLLDWLSGLRVNPGKLVDVSESLVAARSDWKVRKFVCQGRVTYSLPKFQNRFCRWFHFISFCLLWVAVGQMLERFVVGWCEMRAWWQRKGWKVPKKNRLSFWANSGTSRLKNMFTNFWNGNTVRLLL